MTHRTAHFCPLISVLIAVSLLHPASAEKTDANRPRKDAWRVSFKLDTPHLVPPAVQYAVLDYDPVPRFTARLQSMRRHYHQRLTHAKDPADAKLIRESQLTVSWNLGFKEVTGDQVHLLASSPNAPTNAHNSNGPAGKQWIVTKTIRLQKKPVCWCIPFEVKLGQEPEQITLHESNPFDLEATFDKAMADTDKTKQADSQFWRVNLSLDTPHLVPAAVQYAIFDKDPVPGFITRVQSSRIAHHSQATNADPSQAKWARQADMTVSWNLGFKEVTGDKVSLLISAPGTSHSVSSSSPAGPKWIVTKTVWLQDQPVCWCLPFEAEPGSDDTDIILSEANMFDVAATYDKAVAQTAETK